MDTGSKRRKENSPHPTPAHLPCSLFYSVFWVSCLAFQNSSQSEIHRQLALKSETHRQRALTPFQGILNVTFAKAKVGKTAGASALNCPGHDCLLYHHVLVGEKTPAPFKYLLDKAVKINFINK